MAEWSPAQQELQFQFNWVLSIWSSGRVVTMSRYEDIGRKLDLSLNALEGAGADEELKDIAKALNLEIDDATKARKPQVVVFFSWRFRLVRLMFQILFVQKLQTMKVLMITP